LSGHQSELSQLKRFLQPCLLLLIAESPGHGYDLLDRLASFGFERDPGGLYRTLRTMEREGLVRSHWELSDAGPGRRRYELADAGRDQLNVGVDALVETRNILDMYLARYRIVQQQAAIQRGDEAVMKRDVAPPGAHRP
jgi:PadR family transcriptional regulator PadR